MEKPSEIIQIVGFDPQGEPEIRRTAAGRLWLVFNFMPPSWAAEAEEEWEDFDRQLEKAIGTPIVWEDREFFRIDEPAADTVAAIQRFLVDFRERHQADLNES